MKFKFGIVVVSLVLAFSFQASIYGQNTSSKVIDEISQNGISSANVTLYKMDGELIRGLSR